MSETIAAFAERTIRSLKNILYRYMKDYAYKYIQIFTQFLATMNSRNNRRMHMKPNHAKILNLCQYFTVNHSENTRRTNLELEIEFSFQSMIYRSGKVINHNLLKKFLKLLPLLLTNLQHIQSKTNKMKLYVGNLTRRK